MPAGPPVAPPNRTGELDPRRWLVLCICCMSLLIVGLDATIVNVALPAIHRDLHASLSQMQWTIDAYTLVLASLLMVSGSTGDRIGRKRTFSIGLVVFTAGSALCATAGSMTFLIVARALQGVGGSMLNPVAMSIIRNVFVDDRERAQAIGIWGAVIGIAAAAGPVLGGALVDSVGWRYVFLVNVPVGLLALGLTTRYVPESRAPKPRRIDPVGQALVIVGLATLVYAIIEGHDHGWASTEILALFCVSIVAFTALVVHSLRAHEPLIEVRFFRSAPFSGASITAVLVFAAQSGTLFMSTLYLQEVRGLSALVAGLYTLPMAAMMLVLAPLSGRLVGTRGSRLPMLAAGAFITAAPLPLTALTPHTPTAVLLLCFLGFGAGMGLVNPPITNTAVSGMPAAQAGVAAAVASTSRQVGQTLGVAVIGAVVGAGAVSAAIGPEFAHATHAGWWIVACLGVLVMLIAVASTSAWALGTARRTASLFDAEPVPARP